MITLKEDWEFNVLGIYNYLKPGRFKAICDFIINNHNKIEGDVVEAGVYRGGSLIAIAMLLKSLGSKKRFMVLIVSRDFRQFTMRKIIYCSMKNCMLVEKLQMST